MSRLQALSQVFSLSDWLCSVQAGNSSLLPDHATMAGKLVNTLCQSTLREIYFNICNFLIGWEDNIEWYQWSLLISKQVKHLVCHFLWHYPALAWQCFTCYVPRTGSKRVGKKSWTMNFTRETQMTGQFCMVWSQPCQCPALYQPPTTGGRQREKETMKIKCQLIIILLEIVCHWN